MRKFFTIVKLVMGLLLLGGFSQNARAVNFENFTANPTYIDESGFYGMTFEWQEQVTILDASKIYVQYPDYVYIYGDQGLDVSVEGNKLIINAINGPILNNSSSEAWTFAGVINGGITVGGETLEITDDPENEFAGISTQLTWAPGGMSIPEPTFNPPRGFNTASTIDKITINWEDFWVGYSDEYNSWNDVQSLIKIYKGDKSDLSFTYENPISVTLSPEGPFSSYGTRWYNTLIVTPQEELTDPNVLYVLLIPSGALGFKNKDTENAIDTYTEEIEAMFTVTGGASITVEPRQYSTIDYNDWKGLVINNATAAGVTLNNASLVSLYNGYLASNTDVNNAQPVATGVAGSSSSADQIVVTFDYEMVNGSYTIIVNSGAFTGLPTGNNSPLYMDGLTDYQGVRFTLSGNEIDINTVPVTAVPTEESPLEEIESVQVYWGDYLVLLDANNIGGADDETSEEPIPGTLSINGQTQDIEWNILKEPKNAGSDGEVQEYNYSLVYTPQTALTQAGKYVFTIPQNSVIVYVNSQNQLKNNSVTLNYTVSPAEATYIDAEMTVTPENGSLESFLGTISVQWDGVSLIEGPVNLSDITVTLNGQELELGSTDSAQVVNVLESDEQNGGNSTWEVSNFNLSLGSLDFKYGEVKIKVEEGAVMSVNGDINEAFTLNYTLVKVAETPSWTPENPAMSTPGALKATATWTEGAVSVNPNSASLPSLETLNSTGDVLSKQDAVSLLSVVEGNLVFNATSLAVGEYTLYVPQGYLLIGEDYINSDLFYGLSIQVKVELPMAEVTSGLFGNYAVAQNGMSNLDVEYKIGGIAKTIEFVNPLTDNSNTEDPFEYINLNMTAPGSTSPVVVTATLSSGDSGIAPLAEDADETNPAYTILQINLSQVEDFNWLSGDYSVEVPAGVVKTSDGIENQAQTLKFTVLSEYAYVTDAQVDPMPYGDDSNGYYSQEELSAVTLTFDGELTENVGEILYYVKGEENENELLSQYVKVDGKTLVLDLSNIAEGTYTFDIPAGYVVVDNDALFAGKSLTYTIWNGMKPAEVIMGPEQVGVYVSNVELYYGEPIELAEGTLPAVNVYKGWYDETSTPLFAIPVANISVETVEVGEGGEPSTNEGSSTGATTEMPVLYLDIYELFAGLTGDYTIVVPEGLVQNEDGLVNPTQLLQFTLSPMAEEPEVTVTDEGVFSIVWEDAVYVSVNTEKTAYLLLPDGTQKNLAYAGNTNPVGEVTSNSANDGLVIDLTGILYEEGKYELVLPQGYANVEYENDTYTISGELIYTFVYKDGVVSDVEEEEEPGTSAVDSIVNDEAPAGIYNLNGVYVGNDVTKLAKGLYIINGKKVLVK